MTTYGLGSIYEIAFHLLWTFCFCSQCSNIYPIIGRRGGFAIHPLTIVVFTCGPVDKIECSICDMRDAANIALLMRVQYNSYSSQTDVMSSGLFCFSRIFADKAKEKRTGLNVARPDWLEVASKRASNGLCIPNVDLQKDWQSTFGMSMRLIHLSTTRAKKSVTGLDIWGDYCMDEHDVHRKLNWSCFSMRIPRGVVQYC